MRAVVIEPFSAGHRPSYVRWIARAFLDSNIDVVVVGGHSLIGHAELASLANNARFAGIEVAVPPAVPRGFGGFDLWRFEHRMRKWFENAYAKTPARSICDIVFVPYLDYCFHSIAILGSPFGETRWSGITMRTEFCENDAEQSSVVMATRHHLLRRMLGARTTRAMFSIDPRSTAEIRRRIRDSRYVKLRYLPDPAEIESLPDRERSRRELGIDPYRRMLLLFGSIDLRKGLEEMLRGVAATSNPSTWHVVIAGKQTAAASDALTRWRSGDHSSAFRILEINDVVDGPDTLRLFAGADVVWTGYPGHKASSGVLIQAALSGKPVIAQSQTLIGDLVTAANIGIVCEVSQPRAVAAALEAATTAEVRAAAQLNGPSRFHEHTPSNFGRLIVQAVARTDGRAAA